MGDWSIHLVLWNFYIYLIFARLPISVPKLVPVYPSMGFFFIRKYLYLSLKIAKLHAEGPGAFTVLRLWYLAELLNQIVDVPQIVFIRSQNLGTLASHKDCLFSPIRVVT
jgi:hypothetical protein